MMWIAILWFGIDAGIVTFSPLYLNFRKESGNPIFSTPPSARIF